MTDTQVTWCILISIATFAAGFLWGQYGERLRWKARAEFDSEYSPKGWGFKAGFDAGVQAERDWNSRVRS